MDVKGAMVMAPDLASHTRSDQEDPGSRLITALGLTFQPGHSQAV